MNRIPINNQDFDLLLGKSGRVNPNFTKNNGQSLRDRYPELFSRVHFETEHYSVNWKTRLLWYIKGEITLCGTCNAPVTPPADFCCKKCSASSPGIQEKKKHTRLDKNGGSYHAEKPVGATQESHAKSMTTRVERYGAHWTPEMTMKAKATMVDRHGDSRYNALRALESVKEVYGVDNIMKVPGVLQKHSQAMRSNSNRNTSIDPRAFDDSYVLSMLTEKGRRHTKEELGCSDDFIRRREIDVGFRDRNTTAAEEELATFIRSLGLEAECRNRRVIGPRELDVWVPEKRLAIEYDGLYWHSATDLDSQQRLIDNVLEKERLTNEQGISLLRIPEYHWEDPVKRRIWESVIRMKLGMTETSIPARKLMVRELDKETSSAFMQENHLQGNTGHQVALALVDEAGEPVCVSTWSPARYDSQASHELVRFATRVNTHVPGGFTRLVHHAMKMLGCSKQLVSYARKAWSNGDVYETTGWTQESETSYSYFWYKKGVFLNRHQTQKHKLADLLGTGFNERESETENMMRNGWRKVIEPGNITFRFG